MHPGPSWRCGPDTARRRGPAGHSAPRGGTSSPPIPKGPARAGRRRADHRVRCLSPMRAPDDPPAALRYICEQSGVRAVRPLDQDCLRLLATREPDLGPARAIVPTPAQWGALRDGARPAETARAAGGRPPRDGARDGRRNRRTDAAPALHGEGPRREPLHVGRGRDSRTATREGRPGRPIPRRSDSCATSPATWSRGECSSTRPCATPCGSDRRCTPTCPDGRAARSARRAAPRGVSLPASP